MFTLFLIPCLYTFLERFSKNQHRDDTAGEPATAD